MWVVGRNLHGCVGGLRQLSRRPRGYYIIHIWFVCERASYESATSVAARFTVLYGIMNRALLGGPMELARFCAGIL